MNDDQIDLVITARNAITRLHDYSGLLTALDALNVLLRNVPPGARNDVDLLLGRSCAVLPKRVVMVQHADGEQEVAEEFGAQLADHETRRDWDSIKGDLDI